MTAVLRLSTSESQPVSILSPDNNCRMKLATLSYRCTAPAYVSTKLVHPRTWHVSLLPLTSSAKSSLWVNLRPHDVEEICMGISSCCGAPLVVEFHSDTTNFSDDDYDLKVPMWVCSMCGAIVDRESSARHSNQSEPDTK